MKTTIRKGVFETNSSSTHSLSISDSASENEQISFEICSREAKIVLLWGLIENAEFNTINSYQEKLKKKILELSEQIIKAYCDLSDKTKEEALLEIDYEAFSNTYLRKKLNDEGALKEYLKEDEQFAKEFKADGQNDIVAFANKYFVDGYKEFKKLTNGRFRCDMYFQNGCLNDCTCGFESFDRIACQLGISIYSTEEELYQKALEYLSDDFKILAKEYHGGFNLEITGEKY